MIKIINNFFIAHKNFNWNHYYYSIQEVIVWNKSKQKYLSIHIISYSKNLSFIYFQSSFFVQIIKLIWTMLILTFHKSKKWILKRNLFIDHFKLLFLCILVFFSALSSLSWYEAILMFSSIILDIFRKTKWKIC